MGDIAAQFLPLVVSSLPTLDTASHHAVATLLETAANAYSRAIVEECCAGAVVGFLGQHAWPRGAPFPPSDGDGHIIDIPIANAPPSLLEAVAERLFDPSEWQTKEPTCGDCGECPPCGMTDSEVAGQRELDGTAICDSFAWRSPPFAAAWHEGAEGRTYVLVSGECENCGTRGWEYDGNGCNKMDCNHCNGTGASVDMRALADRYQPDRPWRDEDTARVVRFEVKR